MIFASNFVSESVASDSVCEKVAPSCEPMKFINMSDGVKGLFGRRKLGEKEWNARNILRICLSFLYSLVWEFK